MTDLRTLFRGLPFAAAGDIGIWAESHPSLSREWLMMSTGGRLGVRLDVRLGVRIRLGVRLGVKLGVSVAFVDVLDRRRRHGSCQHSRVSGLSGGENTSAAWHRAEWHLDAPWYSDFFEDSPLMLRQRWLRWRSL